MASVAPLPGSPLLETEALVKRFGGLTAVNGVSLSLPAGEIRAIIGPNGAGKSTLVGIICGRLAPSEGRVRYRGRDITAAPPWQRMALGIVYTFQVTSIFKGLTCYENVALPAQRRLMRGLAHLALPEARVQEKVDVALRAVGIEQFADRRADELAYGHQRLLELAMALAAEPQLLVLDEPTQGLAEGEIERFCDLVRSISGRATVLIIEHNMPVVLSLAQRVTVMDAGAVIAEGTPAEVEAHPRVQKAYLGR
jgi:branched-chain amino acid transport system ATP-binding protein